MKRLLDFTASFLGLLVLSIVLVPVAIKVWMQDFHNPFYIPSRVGKDEKLYKMVKMRSMVINADASGVDSTSGNDPRITPVGEFIRKWKLDELTQLWNVMLGDMSLVGPRPNVSVETALYTDVEKKLLSVRPGITDISSIVFSDEGDILADKDDPDIAYNQLIRPWKSRLGLIYIENQSFMLDLRLIFLTVIAIISKPSALEGVSKILEELNAPEDVKKVSKREAPLTPHSPPGTDEIVTSR